MDIHEFEEVKEKAHEKWIEYKEACKENPKDKYLEDMKKVYNQLKSGRKVIDIYEVFRRSGVDDKFQPKLAICPADAEVGYCMYNANGKVIFSDREMGNWYEATKRDVKILNMPDIPDDKLKIIGFNGWNKKLMKTLLPKIPPSLRPKGNLANYYILWEVEEWSLVPPKDPYLLKRITKNMFVVLAGWDLTELERAVMKGRVW